ncbi:MAG: helix-turn-helix domain-containing protein, partial [Oryzihumus sp.]
MSRARLVITAITKQGLTQAEAARTYGLSEATVSRLMARHRAEGDAAFEPRSRRPRTSPGATPPETVELILRLRKQLTEDGHDAG